MCLNWTPSRSNRVALPILAVSLLAAACASSRSNQETIANLAQRLVENLEQRTDPDSIRVLVFEIHESPGAGRHESHGRDPAASTHSERAHGGHDEGDQLGKELEHALVVELSRRLNVVETEHAEHLGATTQDQIGDLARELKATHVLVGDYIRKADRLIVVLRLIDTKTKLITTAVRGWVSQVDLGTTLD